jgi:hypothetical protein
MKVAKLLLQRDAPVDAQGKVKQKDFFIGIFGPRLKA